MDIELWGGRQKKDLLERAFEFVVSLEVPAAEPAAPVVPAAPAAVPAGVPGGNDHG